MPLEHEMFRFICEELAGDLINGRIGHAEVEISKINFRDQLGSEEHLDVELDIHKNTKGTKDGVGPLLFQWGPAESGQEFCQKSSVSLLLGDEEVHGVEIASEVFERCDFLCVSSKACSSA